MSSIMFRLLDKQLKHGNPLIQKSTNQTELRKI